ncbi:MAG: hypothetical protein F2573_04335 [Actinobacteria bacterium]|uniref:Unannotated protein n=1 Tax=freshwater metagenome TaxID=449393 RepID=A0A6J6S095_9ZZZZ|nr:hypothetical protein [Actinomycetota bacterium]MSY82854.1 hypothetical protein [Actinomycetota bacterium]MSZ45951.1 hypothetical protein [Actinomycetota bacterium]MTA22789.1 hypothetical protein [Actinomycetota bacterium]
MMNYRWGGYLLIALGLINLRYQTGHENVLQHSLIIIVPGALVLLATWIKPLNGFMAEKTTKYAALVIGLLLVAYAAING